MAKVSAKTQAPESLHDAPLVLAVNSGSSSLKVGLYAEGEQNVTMLISGVADGVGHANGQLTLKDAQGATLLDQQYTLATQGEALAKILHALPDNTRQRITAVGHRVVHGGPHLTEHQRITPAVEAALEKAVPFAPLHIPPELTLIRETAQQLVGTPQFACFDTAFHRTLPEVAYHYPVPERFSEQGLRRYGFHGLSYESILYRLHEQYPKQLPKRVICAHLGSGASLAAVLNGQSIDTSMGFTPLGGILMGTRPGDLDPGLILGLMRVGELTPDAAEQMLNHECGLYALSGGETDMRALLKARAQGGPHATLAIESFAMSVRKFIGAYAAVLGGVDLLIFSGGIGEHSPVVRRLCCEGLAPHGILPEDGEEPTPQSKVRVMVAEEERQIARHCFRLLD